MAYESDAEPIKMGYIMDFRLPDGFPEERRADLIDPFDMVFADGLEQGVIDRPIEVIYKEVEGLPKGSVKAVIDAFEELVDEGCLLVFGPSITDNAEPDEGRHRGAVQGPDDQRHRLGGVAGRVDVLAVDGLDERRADLLDRPHRQARPQRRRRARRAVAGR